MLLRCISGTVIKPNSGLINSRASGLSLVKNYRLAVEILFLFHDMSCTVTQQRIKNKLTHRIVFTETKVKILQHNRLDAVKQFFSVKF